MQMILANTVIVCYNDMNTSITYYYVGGMEDMDGTGSYN